MNLCVTIVHSSCAVRILIVGISMYVYNSFTFLLINRYYYIYHSKRYTYRKLNSHVFIDARISNPFSITLVNNPFYLALPSKSVGKGTCMVPYSYSLGNLPNYWRGFWCLRNISGPNNSSNWTESKSTFALMISIIFILYFDRFLCSVLAYYKKME